MSELLNSILKFWPIYVGIGSLLLYVGGLHKMVNLNNSAIKRIFDRLEIASAFVSAQQNENSNVKERMDALENRLIDSTKDLSSKLSSIESRIDMIYQHMTNKK